MPQGGKAVISTTRSFALTELYLGSGIGDNAIQVEQTVQQIVDEAK
jgi:hypothetical protein